MLDQAMRRSCLSLHVACALAVMSGALLSARAAGAPWMYGSPPNAAPSTPTSAGLSKIDMGGREP